MSSHSRNLVAILGGSSAVYVALAVMMGVLPGLWLSETPPGPGVAPLTAEQDAGRAVYVSEGCSYCHTQQVRPLSTDSGFGRPSAPGDFAYQTPQLLGSERTGPDLTTIGSRQPDAFWQFIHLYQPRSVVPQSIMPAFPWLFDLLEAPPPGEAAVPVPKSFAPGGGVIVAGARAKALVAYLLALKQPPLPQQAAAGAVSVAPPAAGAAGSRLFADHCAVCHGAEGAGVPGVFPHLAGDPVVNAADPAEQIRTVLHGLSGRTIGGTAYPAAMPAFAGRISDQQIADIINHERSSWGNHAPPVTARDVAAQREHP